MAVRSLLLFCPAVALGMVDVPTMEIAPGVQMPVLSIGTGGDAKWNSSAVKTIVTGWVGQGGRGIDTAWIYGTQGAVKDALRATGVPREELFITTKVPLCLGGKFFTEWDKWLLQLDYVDLLLIHSHIGDCQVTWRQLEDLVRNGQVRALGVSNFGAADLEKLLETAEVMPTVNQIEANVLRHNDETIEYCRSKNITVMAYSPLGQDGKAGGDVVHDATVNAIAASHSVSAYQVALKWLVQRGHILTFQSTNPKHQASDADIFSFELTDDEMATLDGLQAAGSLVV